LADHAKRSEFFGKINAESKKVLVITEGVIPYLTNEQARDLAQELFKYDRFTYWIMDYLSGHALKYLHTPQRRKLMQNAPFQFLPDEWIGFFDQLRWKVYKIRYLPVEAIRLNRLPPTPWWLKILIPFMSTARKEQFLKSSGYMVLIPSRLN
jgi:O-methyltransferase involved in polyketide biosynthesis